MQHCGGHVVLLGSQSTSITADTWSLRTITACTMALFQRYAVSLRVRRKHVVAGMTNVL